MTEQQIHPSIVPIRPPTQDSAVNQAYYQRIGQRNTLLLNVPYDRERTWLSGAHRFAQDTQGLVSFVPVYGRDAHSVFVHLNDLYAQGQQGFFIRPPTSTPEIKGERQPGLVFYEQLLEKLGRSSMTPSLLLYNSCKRSVQLPVECLEDTLSNDAVVGVVQNIYEDTRHFMKLLAMREKLAAQGKQLGVYVNQEEHALSALLVGATGALFATGRVGLEYGADLVSLMARVPRNHPLVQREQEFLTALVAGDTQKLEGMIAGIAERGSYVHQAENLPSFTLLHAASYLGKLGSPLMAIELRQAVGLQRNINELFAEANALVAQGSFPSVSQYFDALAKGFAQKIAQPKQTRSITIDADTLYEADENERSLEEAARASGFYERLARRSEGIRAIIEKDMRDFPERNIAWWGSGIVYVDTKAVLDPLVKRLPAPLQVAAKGAMWLLQIS